MALLATPFSGANAKKTQVPYTERVQQELDRMSGQIRKLELREGAMDKETKARFEKALKMLWQKEKVARVQLERLRHAPAEEREKRRHAQDSLLVSLQKSYRYVTNHYGRGK